MPIISGTTNPAVLTPKPPSHLPLDIQQQWTATYQKTYAQAAKDYPGNERAARMAATKAANAIQSVPAPASAEEIEKLAKWQLLKRETRTVRQDGADVKVLVAVTIDGRKYQFPLDDKSEGTEPATPSQTSVPAKGAAAK